jgi:DNA-binding response OmpR family regulator
VEKKYKILVVDDETDLCEILEFNLENEGFDVDVAHSAEEALKMPIESYSLILLDVMMGGISGFKAANIIRKEMKIVTPIIFITAKTEENDLLTGFSLGGDDYIQKPFSIREVIARVKAVIKRGKAADNTLLKFEELTVDTERKISTINNDPINLTRKEFDILVILMRNKGRYISREQILEKVWSDDVVVTERNVDVNITRLRKKIDIYGAHIKGKTGYGYLFEE